jgi:two-component system CheB/CheR fusion protein
MQNTNIRQPERRANEFLCLCKITRIAHSPDITLREIIYEIVELLPCGFQCPSDVWCRVTLNDEEIVTRGRSPSNRKISAHILAGDKPVGTVEAGYVESSVGHSSGAFTEKERLLLEAAAEVLSSLVASQEAEDLLRLNEDKFTKAFHASPNIVSLSTFEDDRIIEINDSSTRLTGWSPRELIGRRFTEIGFWKSDEERQRVVDRLKVEGIVRDIKVEWRGKSGDIHVGRLTANLINVGGRPCIMSIINDVTQQNEDHEMLQTVVRSSPFGIFILKDGAFTYTNPRFEAITGYSHAELHGCKLISIVAAEDADLVAAGIIFTVKHEKPCPCEYRLLSKNGQIKWVLQTVSQVHYRHSNAILGNIMDVTELKYLERKVVEYEELSKMKSDLLSTVSHELRTPLATIKGYATMILDYFSRLEADETKDYLRAIDGSTDRLTKLVDKLLDTSRLDAGLLKLQKSPTSISQLIRKLVEEAGIRNTGHAITARLGAGLPHVNIDTKRICQVLDNLIENAVKYSPAGTQVTVFAEKSGPDLLVGISDQGPGIPARELEKIFDRMYRIENRFDSSISGLGLGLYICQRLVQAHGGRIWAESTLGQGSTIKFTLPAARHPERAEDREPEASAAAVSTAAVSPLEREA